MINRGFSKKTCILFFAVTAVLFIPLPLSAGVGESAVITLVFPFGARSGAMGETGTALADDNSALFFNPARLGIRNESWRKGAVGYSFEPLLPAFDIKDLWHSSYTGYYQISDEYGGIGVYYNYLNIGQNQVQDYLYRDIKETASYETVAAAGWGCLIASTSRYTQSIGFSLKYFSSALAPGLDKSGAGTASSFAVDAGYLGIFSSGIRLGITLANMGPAVFYIDKEREDPIPFTLNTAAGYTYDYTVDNVRALAIAAELRFDKEFVVNRFDGKPDPFYKAFFTDMANESLNYELQEINTHFGVEFVFLNTVAFRQGWLIDPLGERYEAHSGLGLTLFNHIHLDYSYINAPEDFGNTIDKLLTGNTCGSTGARDGQWQICLTVDALLGWDENDREWWKVTAGRKNW